MSGWRLGLFVRKRPESAEPLTPEEAMRQDPEYQQLLDTMRAYAPLGPGEIRAAIEREAIRMRVRIHERHGVR